ncbi:MAG: hypothetical protein ACK6A7_05290, partial [Planctomycetota bacterium]
MSHSSDVSHRRRFLSQTLASGAAAAWLASGDVRADDQPVKSRGSTDIPPDGKRILWACKLSMIQS